MEKVEFFGDPFLSVSILESGLISADFDQRMLESYIDAILTGYTSQCLGVFGYSKHHTDGLEKININRQLLLSPSICPEIQNLLRSSCTLNRHSWLREDGLA
jgi:hypothetical protein